MEIIEALYHSYRQDCYEDPLLIGSHLLKVNEVSNKIPVINAIKFMHRSAWVEINRNKFDSARKYFKKIKEFVELIKKKEHDRKRIRFYTKLSADIETIFLDIIYGKPSKMIERKLDRFEEKLRKREQTEFTKGLLVFEIEWIKGYLAYLRGKLEETEVICNNLIKTKEYRQLDQCKQLVHAVRGKVYFKTGRIQESIIESKLLSDVESSGQFKNQTILKTSDSSSIAMWLSGYTDQAIEILENAEKKHTQHSNIRGQITTYWDRIILHTIDYNSEQMSMYVEKAMKTEVQYCMMSKRGFTSVANYLLTLVDIIKGQRKNINGIESTISNLRKHTTLYEPFWKTILAEAYLKTKNYEDCSRCIGDAFNISNSTGERFYLPETHRVNAELKMAIKQEKDAKKSYEDALDITRNNKTTLLELRILNSFFCNYHPLSDKHRKNVLSTITKITKTLNGRKASFDSNNANKILNA